MARSVWRCTGHVKPIEADMQGRRMKSEVYELGHFGIPKSLKQGGGGRARRPLFAHFAPNLRRCSPCPVWLRPPPFQFSWSEEMRDGSGKANYRASTGIGRSPDDSSWEKTGSQDDRD